MGTQDIPEIEKEILQEFKRRLVEAFGVAQVQKVILFGSKARGDFRKGSDIDVMVVLQSKNREIQDKIHEIIMDLLFERGFYLSVMIYSEEQYNRFNHIPTVFMQLVARDGVNI